MSDHTAVTSGKEFAAKASDLTDDEIQKSYRVITEVQRKYANKPNTRIWLDQLRDEVLTRLSEVGILATFDPTPCFYGEPPALEILGKVSTDPIHKHGFDHEKKEYEVRKATERGEDFLGQKETPNTRGKRRKDSLSSE